MAIYANGKHYKRVFYGGKEITNLLASGKEYLHQPKTVIVKTLDFRDDYNHISVDLEVGVISIVDIGVLLDGDAFFGTSPRLKSSSGGALPTWITQSADKRQVLFHPTSEDASSALRAVVVQGDGDQAKIYYSVHL